MKKYFLIVGFWFLLGNVVYGGEPITAKNWVNHPDIVEVRSIYQKVLEAKEAGSLKKKERKFKYCKPYEDIARILYMDRNGKPRLYYYEGGSDDSAVQRELYYDENGKLRFAFITAGAANGTRLEHRVYFSKDGKKIWEIQKFLEGPGYTFPTVWPDEELIQDPVKAYKEKNLCPEIK
jgi:hypothetical protein